MQPHQQRVIDEKNELDDKATKLSAFIGENPLFEKLDAAEQDADQIGLLWRADYQGEEDTGEACLDLAKNRNGPTGRIPLTFIKELARFESGRPAPEPEPHGFGR